MWYFVIVLNKVVLTCKSVDETLAYVIKIKAIEQYFHVVLFIMLYKVLLTFKSVEEIASVHSNESY